MGQKGNIFSLRKFNYPTGSLIFNSKLFLYSFNFSNILEKILLKKNIILTGVFSNFTNNQGFFNFSVFFRTSKLIRYKKKLYNFSLPLNKIKQQTPLLSLNKFLKQQFKLFGISIFFITIQTLNKKINKSLVSFFYLKLKQFIKTLFSRRFTLFFDFLKLNSLFCLNFIKAKTYLFVLGQVFKNLQKKKHRIFLDFLEIVFKTIVFHMPAVLQNNNSIKGIKFIISGKLGGKARSSTSYLLIGSVPTQSISKNIDFAKIHVYTVYGVYGFKIWVFR